tara:strand:+ start:2633 stop:3358 length:726 start_codon:yes stop_codon:yes gene_type:complete
MVHKHIPVSFGIPVCNEHEELDILLTQLNASVHRTDQIVVQFDKGNTTDEVAGVCQAFEEVVKCEFLVVEFPLNGDFAAFKNNLKSKCTKNFIFQIDADEYLGVELLGDGLQYLLQQAEEDGIDAFYISRINCVQGLTDEYVISQNWNVSHIEFPVAKPYDNVVVNFPDRQGRLLRNSPYIKWQGNVHERLVGLKSFTSIPIQTIGFDKSRIDPDNQAYCLIHLKELDRQKRQNEMYDKLI